MESAAQGWRDDLATWAIPDDILAAAPESPWIHPVEMFVVGDQIPDSPSHRRAREVEPNDVLDVGCGGGRAALALVPPASRVIGVDGQQGMLDRFAQAAQLRGVAYDVVLGDWPAVEESAPTADVVVCHHVAYNVPALPEFLLALSRHGRRRVVMELPERHPLTHMAPLWRDFWGIDRPTRPTAQDCLEVALEAGIDATLDVWTDEPFESRTSITPEQQAHYLRVRLCLPPERESDVAAALASYGPPAPRRMATLWWDL
jgi:SAM-dependent methyltransferase